MSIKELYEKISDQQFKMKKGIANSVNHSHYYDQMKNVLLNNLDAIVDALRYAVDAENKIRVLEVELNDAERELDEKDKLLKEKTTKSKKNTAEGNG